MFAIHRPRKIHRRRRVVGADHGLALCALLSAPVIAHAANLRAIYTVIPASPTSSIPGARDLTGALVPAKWTTFLSLSVRQNAPAPRDEWVVRGFDDLGPDLQNILVRGSGITGNAFMQEGQPIQGASPPTGELYDFFDSPPVAWNATGLMGYSFRARGGTTTDDEKIGIFNGSIHTITYQQGSPLTGLANCSGPSIGNSVGAVHVLNNSQVAFGNTPVQGCPGGFYPALFHNNVAIAQSGVTPVVIGNVGEEIAESIPYDSAAFTFDGAHYAVPATTNNPNTAQDRILLIDGAAVLREGLVIPSTSIVIADFFKVRYGGNNAWYARGDDPSDNDWAVRSGTLLAATGQPITTGSTEHWGNAFSTLFGTTGGDWYLAGNTDNVNLNLDNVIVRNGTQVLVRENDPVDVDGDGLYDDDAFVSSFKPDAVYLTDSNVLYFLCVLRNAAGASLGDAFVHADLAVACFADIVHNNIVDVDDLLAVITHWGACPPPCPPHCPADIAPQPNGNCTVNVDDLLGIITHWGACP